MAIFVPRTIICAVLAVLLSQGAAATWYTGGSYEPDNALDDTSFMPADPPGMAKNVVYFNVITGSSGPVGGTFVNPNVGMLETRSEAPTLETHQAMLGVWTDCDGDGYIGMAAGAMREYPSNLLDNATLCAPVTGAATTWAAGANNYNGWVSEFIPIGDANPLDRRTYGDAAAMIWGDYGRPGQPSNGGGTCPIAPQPRGTYQSTGGFLNYVDCNTGLLNYWNIPWHGARYLAQDIPGLNDFGVDLGLDFDNDDNASGTWIDHPTFGTEDTSHSPAYVYDCEAEPVTLANGVSTYAIAPRLGNTGTPAPVGNGATIPALVNHTMEGSTQDCDTSNDAGHDFYGAKIYVGETDFNAVSGANKREANFNFGFGAVQRGRLVAGQVPAAPGGAAGFNLGPNYSGWGVGLITLKAPATVRVDLVEGTTRFPDAGYLTFFAHVGATTVNRGVALPGGSDEYGSEQCGIATSGILNGWNCDAATWYRNSDGTAIPEPTRPLARPGQVYELRDVDCYDGGVGDSDIGLGTPHYGDAPCPPA